MNSHSLLAPAKLNLFLHITGKRADGYHLLDSLVVFTEFGDELTVEKAEALSLDVTGPFAQGLGPREENLVWKAASRLGAGRGARIGLQKNIPVGAGIGGGSSDAAAALTALSALWKLDAPLADMALALGSDVPVCLRGAPAYMRGVGEHITPVTLDVAPFVVLVNPGVALATADVFKMFRGEMKKELALPERIETTAQLIELIAPLDNALQETAVQLLPVIGEVLGALRATGHCLLARMSGSGATCFGLYEHEHQARAAQQALQAQHPHWWSVSTRIRHG